MARKYPPAIFEVLALYRKHAPNEGDLCICEDCDWVRDYRRRAFRER